MPNETEISESIYNVVELSPQQFELFTGISVQIDLLLNRIEFMLLINIVLLSLVIFQMIRGRFT